MKLPPKSLKDKQVLFLKQMTEMKTSLMRKFEKFDINLHFSFSEVQTTQFKDEGKFFYHRVNISSSIRIKFFWVSVCLSDHNSGPPVVLR